VRGPGVVLDIAFGGASHDTGAHTKQQQALQQWLFERCNRLPSSGSAEGLRSECKKKIATFVVALEQYEQNGAAAVPSKIRSEAVVALGLGSRSTYIGAYYSETEAAEDVQQATQTVKSDGGLQAMMKRPNVAAALERIAADPSAIRNIKDPEVLEVLEKLNGLLKG